MGRIALMMLFGARGRYAALIFGLSFAVLLITQQLAIFLGVLDRATGPLQNMGIADIWVAAAQTEHVDIVRGINEREVARVRSVPGVAWAEPYISVPVAVELPTGGFQQAQVEGIDRVSMVGRPPEMLDGDINDLLLPDAIVLETTGRKFLAMVTTGAEIRLNERRARVIGICRARPGILSRPQVFTTIENARRFAPTLEGRITNILVKLKDGADRHAVLAELHDIPETDAFTADDLRFVSKMYIMFRTSIGLNFALTVGLGLVVGLVVSAAAFNQFTGENLPHYALLKAVGTRPLTLIGLVLLQAMVAGLIGYGIGIGLAGLMTIPGLAPDAELSSLFPWQLMVGGVLPMLVCIGVGSVMSIRRVIKVDPVTLFQ